ncbi:hypothetical protein COV19_06225 [Candidatus Woesearchaeota archaeon CG10_big_fil_rev_8_21_14_0_10_44_13]|nr:MAG: hypothetical protein COV19_06225 [Candidatus Woesearchaeota archaeon CG10_big_fil_rev_8_21_14_0_10_44_13]
MSFNGAKLENASFNGITLVCGDKDVFERAKSLVTRPKEGFREVSYLPTKKEFMNYFAWQELQKDGDWVYFFDTSTSHILKYKGSLINKYPGVDNEDIIRTALPKNFLSEDETKPTNNIGTRTEVAALTPLVDPNIEVIILTQSDLGRLSHFNADALIQTFQSRQDKKSCGPYIDDITGVAATYACYRDDNGNATRNMNGELVPFRQSIVNMHLEDYRGVEIGPYRGPKTFSMYNAPPDHASIINPTKEKRPIILASAPLTV